MVFQTVNVTVRLQDSLNGDLADGAAKYYAGGWKEFGTTGADGEISKELLPNSYKFRMTYLGGVNEQTQNVSSDPVVVFQTANVIVRLQDSLNGDLAGGTVKYYAGGWKEFGTTGAGGVVNKELLPKSYKFRMTYLGGVVEKTQDVAANPTVAFATVEVTIELRDHQDPGVLLDEAGLGQILRRWLENARRPNRWNGR